jgi:hypothetical protein
MLPY